MGTFVGRAVRSEHSIRVCRVYRAILKEQMNWLVSRDAWNPAARAMRNAFRANMYLGEREAVPLVENAENHLAYWRHPIPYAQPYLPGGSTFQRNVPPPYDTTLKESFVEWL